MCFRLSPLPPLSTLHSPSHHQLYFILCGFCDKLKLSLHPAPVSSIPSLPSLSPCALLHVPGKIHFFVLYGFYDFSISFATSRSTRELYQFARARDLPINFKDDVAMRIRYASLYVHSYSKGDSDINYFNCHMSFTLPEIEVNGETWGALQRSQVGFPNGFCIMKKGARRHANNVQLTYLYLCNIYLGICLSMFVDGWLFNEK